MPGYFYVRVKGHLDSSWSVWFDRFDIKYDDYGDTLLSGVITDREEWISLLESVHDNNLKLVSVYPTDIWLGVSW